MTCTHNDDATPDPIVTLAACLDEGMLHLTLTKAEDLTDERLAQVAQAMSEAMGDLARSYAGQED